MKKKLKKKAKKRIRRDSDEKYVPKLYGESKAVSFEIILPTGKDTYYTNFCLCTAWANGEGFDFNFTDDKGNEKSISLHETELEIMLASLNHLGFLG